MGLKEAASGFCQHRVFKSPGRERVPPLCSVVPRAGLLCLRTAPSLGSLAGWLGACFSLSLWSVTFSSEARSSGRGRAGLSVARWQSFGGRLSLVCPVLCSFPIGSPRSSLHSRWCLQSTVELSGHVAPRSRPCEADSEAGGTGVGGGPAPKRLPSSQRLATGGKDRQGLNSTGQRPQPSRLNDNPPNDTGGDGVGPRKTEGPFDQGEPTSPPLALPRLPGDGCIYLGRSGLRGPCGHPSPGEWRHAGGQTVTSSLACAQCCRL